MTVHHGTFKIQSDRRPTFEDVTERVEKVLIRFQDKKRHPFGIFTAHHLQRIDPGSLGRYQLLGY